MADSVNWDVILRLAVQGAKSSANELNNVLQAAEGLSRQGKVTEKTLESITRASNRTASSSSGLADAQKRLGNAMGNQAFESQISGLGKIEALQARVTRAAEERRSAESRLSGLQGRGTQAQLTAATNDVTRAVNAQTSATKGLNSAQANATNQSAALRYANYDVARTMFTVAGAFTAAGTAAAVAFGSQESAFTSVERIVEGSSDEISSLRDELTALSTEIPRSFQDLSSIASFGAALDIPAESLTAFTDVVARFASVTGVTEEAAATGFGRIAQYLKVPADEFENLGSAILRAGNISVATEEQVLKFTQALSPAAARVGFTTDETIALGAALASFGNINVEGAGSALSRITNTIERALGEGGAQMENFARVAGMSSAQFRIAWESDASGTFNAMLRGLSTVDNLTLALDDLGIRNERDRRTIQALAQNYDSFTDILGDTTSAWREGTYMSEAYGYVLDDLNSKWQIFVNAVTNAAAAVGSAAGPALKQLLDIATNLLVTFADFASSDLGQVFFRLVGSIAAIVAAYAALRGVIALATGATLALNAATRLLGSAGIMAGLRGLGAALGLYKRGADGAAISTFTLRGALVALGRATIIIGAVQLLSEVFFNLGGVLQNLRQPFFALMDLASGAAKVILRAGRAIAQFLSASPLIGASFTQLANVSDKTIDSIADMGNKLTKFGYDKTISNLSQAKEETQGLGGSADAAIPPVEDLGEGLDNLGNSAEAAAQKVYTLTDYASDLSGVWNRAFEIRFNGTKTLDAIADSFQSIREATDAAEKSIRSLKAEIQGLESDLNIQQRFLAVAVEYRDFDRVQAIQANIAKIQADLASKTEDLNKEQQANSKTLVGNSAAARANRTTITDLVSEYQAHIAALAASGLSQDELARRTDQLRRDFIAQATQLGFNANELGVYEQAFRDVTVAIQGVPRDITVGFNADPAIQALNEFTARVKSEMASAGSNAGSAFASGVGGALANNPAKMPVQLELDYKYLMDQQSKIRVATGNNKLKIALGPGGQGGTTAYAEGGFTGQGGKYEPAGIVHRGEYVVPKKYVNQRTGLPDADAMGRLQRGAQGRSGYAGGGYVSGGGAALPNQISLTPMTIQQLAMVMDKVINVDGQLIASVTSQEYAHGTNVGAN